MVKLYISIDSDTRQEIAYIYSDTHDRLEMRQAASQCGIDRKTEYLLGFLAEPETKQTEPTMIPLIHYNLQGTCLEKAKLLFRLVDEKELADDLDKVFKIVQDRLKQSNISL